MTDVAFGKDDNWDFQKRWKALMLLGQKPNTQARYGRKIERTVYIRISEKTSPFYTDIKKSLQQGCKRP